MKKLFLVAFVLLSTSVFAQKTWDYSIGGNSIFSKAGNDNPTNPGTNPNYGQGYGIREGEQPTTPLPIAPATLLLLGLGGATVGTAVCRNQKRRK